MSNLKFQRWKCSYVVLLYRKYARKNFGHIQGGTEITTKLQILQKTRKFLCRFLAQKQHGPNHSRDHYWTFGSTLEHEWRLWRPKNVLFGYLKTWKLTSNGYFLTARNNRLRRFWAFYRNFCVLWNLEFCGDPCVCLAVTRVLAGIFPQ